MAITKYVGETLITPRIKTNLLILVVLILWVLFLEEFMLCFLVRLRSLILFKNCGPKFVFLSKICVVHKVLFLLAREYFKMLSIRIFSVVTIGSNSICLNYIEHCVMSHSES